MKKQIIRLVIADLDNTLYNWVSSFVPAFYAMVDVAADILKVDKEKLLDELRSIHQRYRNSEQPFALLETPSVENRFPGLSRLEKKYELDPAFAAFNKKRKRHLHLYPGVERTITQIRDAGCGVVGYTEAILNNSIYRLAKLGVMDDFDAIYAPASRADGHPDPSRQYDFEPYRDKIHLLPDDHRKPDPTVLTEICAEYDADTAETLYVGDSMTRDVAMAKQAGVVAVWAKYGSKYDPTDWQKLVRVTHWTDEDVARERILKEELGEVRPDLEIESFPELLEHFEFGPLVCTQPTRDGAALQRR